MACMWNPRIEEPGSCPQSGHPLFEGCESDGTVLSAADTAPAMEAGYDKAARDIADTPTP